MSTAVQRRRGTTAQHASFAGLNGELTVDTDKEVVVVHDGATAGGYPMMRENGSNSALALGSAATPSLKFTGDTNTGIYSPGADQVAISTNGQGRLYVDASGNVGVGTANPVGRLTIKGAANATAAQQLAFEYHGTTTKFLALGVQDASGHAQIMSGSGAALIFYTNSDLVSTNERLRITSTGLVGVGGSPIAARLASFTADVGGTIGDTAQIVSVNTNGAVGDFSGIRFNYFNDGNTGGKFAYIGSVLTSGVSNGAADIVFGTRPTSTTTISERLRITSTGALNFVGAGTAGSTQAVSFNGSAPVNSLVIDSSGRLGVGTSSPVLPLTVAGAIAVGGAGNNGIQFYNASPTATALRWLIANNQGDSDKLSIYRYDSSGNFAGTPLVIDSSNRVGIGSSAPQELLNVNGNILVGVDGTATASEKIIRSSNTSTSFGNDSGANLVLQSGAGTGQYGSSIQFRTPQPSNIANTLGTQTTRMTIDTQGRVGIGTTPGTDNRLHIADTSKAATARTGVKLQTTDSLAADTGLPVVWSGNIGTQSDYTWASITGRKENATSGQAGGYLQFATGSSGGAVEERVRITSTGAVGIGATPLSKFHVNLATNENIHFSGGSGDTRIGSYNDAFNTTVQLSIQGSPLLFRSAGGLEAARIDSSSRLLVGTSTSALERLVIKADGGGIQINRNETGNPTSGQALGSIGFKGVVSANSNAAAEVLIQAAADEAHSGSTAGSRLEFHTKPSGTGPGSSPTERMRIDNAGRIFTYNANTGNNSLTVASAAAAGTAVANFIGAYGATGINTGTSSFIVWTNGNVQNTNNSYTAISDVKLKENIVDANSQWDDIKALQVRNYNLKEGQTHRQIGLIAQEVEPISPGLVYESPDRDEDGNDLGTVTKSVNYSVLYMKAVKALQEAMERIETLEAKVAALETP